MRRTAIEREHELASVYLHKLNARPDSYWKKAKTLQEAAKKPGTASRSLATFYSLPDFSFLVAAIKNQLGPNKKEGLIAWNEDFAKKYEASCRTAFQKAKILEIGARHGVLVDFLNSHGAEAKGVDLDEQAAEIAGKLGTPVIRNVIQHTDPNKTGKFNVVCSHQFFDPLFWTRGAHDKTMQEIADKMYALLEKGGLSIHTVIEIKELPEIYRGSSLSEEMLTRAGFKIITHKVVGGMHVSIARKPK